ncbi:hypothetical protein MXB_2805, partial [Myxobolus squamalis]
CRLQNNSTVLISKYFIIYAVYLHQPVALLDRSKFEGYSAHWQVHLWEDDRGYSGIIEQKTYTVDQIQIQSMDLRLIPNKKNLNIWKNATILFDSAAFTIPLKKQGSSAATRSKKENHQILQYLADDAFCLLQENNPFLIDRTYQITVNLFHQA